jgi:hypothetical protein
MPRYDVIRKKQRQIILSAAAKKELCEKFKVKKAFLSLVLYFKRDSRLSHEIRNSALNEHNGILIER